MSKKQCLGFCRFYCSRVVVIGKGGGGPKIFKVSILIARLAVK